jgi:putative hemolysin
VIDALQLMFVFICMFGYAFFSGIETGVTAINRLRLKHFVRQQDKAAEILQGFLDDSDRLLGATLTGANVCLVVVSVFSVSLAGKWFGSWAEPVVALLVSIVVLMFCEYVPKAWFTSKPYFRSARFASVLLMMEGILKPLSFTMVGLTRVLVPDAKRSFAKPLPFVSREDLKTLTKDGERSGVLSRRETSMINRVFELSTKKAAEIMIPREKMLTVESDVIVEDFLALARTRGVTRMPVYDSEKKQYVGIVNVLFVLSSLPASSGSKVGDLTRPVHFIPADMPVDDIFPRLRRSRQPMGLVRNKKEEVVGLVTTEDILEEIVGEL